MKSKQTQEADPVIYVLVLEAGDELIGELERFAAEHRLDAASFTGLGAFSGLTLRYFDREKKEYLPIPVDEQVEALNLTRNIALKPGGGVKAHTHAVVGRRDGTAMGGDLGEAHVWPTLELVVIESPQHLRRTYDEQTGLALIDPSLA